MKHFRLGLYDPCDDSRPPRLAGPVFDDTPEDREMMQTAIETFYRLAPGRGVTLCLAPFPVEG